MIGNHPVLHGIVTLTLLVSGDVDHHSTERGADTGGRGGGRGRPGQTAPGEINTTP